MSTATIPLEVDVETARAYDAATPEERRKLQLLLGQRLRELTSRPARPLPEVMDTIGRDAETRGITPQLVEALLRDE